MKDIWNKTKPSGGAFVFLVLTAILAGLLVAEVAKGELPLFGNGSSTKTVGKVDTQPQ